MFKTVREHNAEKNRPTCINPGCGKPVAFSNTAADGRKRWRIHCSHCQKASYGKNPHAAGVTPFKTGRCSNVDQHLGFPCPINYEAAPWMIGQTEVDHRDGNYFNNDVTNLDELCPCCHKEKGKRAGDFDSSRKLRAA